MNIGLYLATLWAPSVVPFLSFIPVDILKSPWTLVTHVFLHTQASHLAFDVATLVLFGPRVERQIGQRGLALVFLASGFGGSLVAALAPHTPFMGTTGAVCGIMMAYNRFWGHETILPGLPPIANARWVVLSVGIVALLPGVLAPGWGLDRIAVAGGMLAGWRAIAWYVKQHPNRRVEAPNSEYHAPGVREVEAKHRWESINVSALHEVNRVEVERLLQQIRLQGPASLTEQERALLDRMAEHASRLGSGGEYHNTR